jgi:hypothetical protein
MHPVPSLTVREVADRLGPKESTFGTHPQRQIACVSPVSGFAIYRGTGRILTAGWPIVTPPATS